MKTTLLPNYYEKLIWAQKQYLCGIDEVGRGCFAGPVVTAAVILHPDAPHTLFPLLKDSKILSEKQRLKATKEIKKYSWHAYGIVSPYQIDKINIYEATKKAMIQAFYGVTSYHPYPEHLKMVLVDAVPLFIPTHPEITVISFPFGEQRSISIAAASIIAKVKRDELVTRLEISFPGYFFAQHKGYGTAEHRKVLHARGASLIHRLSFDIGLTPFLKKIDTNQKSIF